ncbi:uncharacterized protein ACA1_367290 [Acanthamoeba castellanii str. Neff]|uniref:Uncharacterized protein n=1 Tax=Acanthamoeba castellanii (strain ATCC 30010 / Neff) TaxID=1257118 RepID=L8GPR8_ACACF|nr:uncharacterized protein ACA1_367290 [Acanthamoeba castellanii str. Neff]ELR14096.1 hypothetical protein ACA1_367290 [Acanthamoeba castellanii str. Neff]
MKNDRAPVASQSIGRDLIILLFLTASLLASPVFSVTITVCSSGCGYPSIGEAVNAAAPGDTVVVAAGNYEETSQLNSIVSGITLQFDDVSVSCSQCSAGPWFSLLADAVMEGTLTIVDSFMSVDDSTFQQNGNISISSKTATGVSISTGATWAQKGTLSVQLQAGASGSGVQVGGNSHWIQDGAATIHVTNSTSGYGVYLNGVGATWQQNGLLTIETEYSGAGVELQTTSLWGQAGKTLITATGGVAVTLGGTSSWQQNNTGQMRVSDTTGVAFLTNATWLQLAGMTIEVTSTNAAIKSIGVDMRTAGIWVQSDSIAFGSTGSNVEAIACTGSVVPGWTSSANVSGYTGACAPSGTAAASATPSSTPLASRTATPSAIPSRTPTPTASAWPTVTPTPTPSPSRTPTPTASISPTVSPTPTPTPSSTASPSTSRTPSPSVTPSFSPSSSPVYLISNTTTVESVPVLKFNLTAPDIILLPKDNQGTVQSKAAVGVSLAQLKEVDDDGATVRLGTTVSGSWKPVVDSELGASSSYLFTGGLDTFDAAGDPIATSNSSGSRVELQFYLFDTKTNISVGDLAFDALPSFAKFSIRLFDWQWASPADRIELRMKINPSFINFTRQPNTPQAGVTTFILTGQYAAEQDTKTQLRLIDAIELDGRQVGSGVLFDLDAATSELVLRFDYFNSTLVYDPDLGVLFGSPARGEGSSGSDSMPLIIAVSVAVPVAIVLVIGAAVLITVIAHRNRKQRRRRLTKTMQMHQL